MAAGGTTWDSAGTLELGNGNTFTRSSAAVGTVRPYYRAWWQFTASVSGSVTLDTYGSTAGDIASADTLIYVYNVASEPVDVNAWFGRNDDTDENSPPAPGEYLSKLTFEAAEGVTYHVLIGTYSATGDTVTQYRVNAVGAPLGGVAPVSVWTQPLRLTTDSDPFGDPGSDEGSLASGDLCHLGNNLVVVMDFSSWSYAVRLWAIDISGPTPVVGPMKVVNGTDDDFSWMTTPHPGDPRGAAMYPCTFVIPLTSTTFAIVGPGNETYNASGNLDGSGKYVHAASFFEVNPTTKVITRTAFVVVDYTTLGPPPWGAWVDDVTAAALGTNAVVLMDVSENYVLIARNDGSTTVYLNIDGLSNPNFNSPVVFDEDVMWLAFDYLTSPDDQILYRMQHAIGSSSVVQGDVLVGSGDWITDQFVTKTSTGLAAFLTSANHVSQRSNIMLSLIDHDTLAANTPTLVVADTWTFGWTSDWGGNVKSITAMEDGKMLVSYVEFYDRLMHFVEVSATKTPGTPELIPFSNPNGYFVQMARSCYGVGKMAAIQVRQTNASYEGGTYIFGVYFIVRDFAPPVVEPEGPADPYPEAARVHFWGQ